jgi:hypothetical protein
VQKKYLATLIGIYLASTVANASPYGVNISYLLVDKDPQYLKGYRLSFLYQPPAWKWEHLYIFFDTSAGHWRVNQNVPYQSLNIYSFAPVFRFYARNSTYVSPFIDISLGLAYLTKTRIADRNLGMHFSFQDQLGIGASFGKEKRLSVSVNALHYSNGSLCSMNAGITVPVMLNVSYQF